MDINSKLTKREIEISSLAKEGFSDQEVSVRLDISLHTVKNHFKNIYKKLNVQTRPKLVALLNKEKMT
jgi:DNA-binding CsgD family transcriptional regulator